LICGKCACGAVAYQVKGELVDLCHCHCSICRKIAGAAFSTWGGVSRDQFSYICGEDNLNVYSFSENADSISCKTCSSTLLVDFKPETHMLYITLGAVDGEIDCPVGFHQFVGSRASWFEITDSLPQFHGWPEEE
jgi:hypothetical protein